MLVIFEKSKTKLKTIVFPIFLKPCRSLIITDLESLNSEFEDKGNECLPQI